MSIKKFALIALTGTALATPAFATDVDQLMKEINALKAKVNELSKKQATAPAANASSGPTVNYVKTCEAQGDGFFVIPGSTTCIKLSGYMRGDGYYNQKALNDRAYSDERVPSFNVGSRFRLETDVRSSTPIGTIRGYARLNMDVAQNSYGVDGNAADANLNTANGGTKGNFIFSSNSSSFPTSISAEYAYVNIGGLTAGIQNSAFDFYNQADTEIIKSDDKGRQLGISYTATLGGGVSLTGAVENPYTRSQNASLQAGNGDGGDLTGDNSLKWGLPNFPDLVGAVQYSQAPLTVKLSGALHSNQSGGENTDGITYLKEGANDSGTGYALQAGAKYVISPETTITLQGTYADGAMAYLGYGARVPSMGTNNAFNVASYTGLSFIPDFDPYLGPDVTSNGWSVMGALNQKIGDGTFSLVGSYGDMNDVSDKKSSDAKGDQSDKDFHSTVTQVELNYLYKPFSGLNIKPAVAWIDVENTRIKDGVDHYGNSYSQFRSKLSIWRDF